MDIYLDFETRSELSVTDVGAWVYSRHPSTAPLCLAMAVADEPVCLYRPHEILNNLLPDLTTYMGRGDLMFHAHNAGFEQAIWLNVLAHRHGFPKIPIHRWRCTAAKAASMSLPRSLDGVGDALNLPIRKDKEGHRIMLKLSRPRQNGQFWQYEDCPEDFEKLYAYCKRDVEVERAADKLLPNLNAFEQRVWFLDQKINMRGVQIDVPVIKQIQEFITQTKEDMTEEFAELVPGINVTQVAKLKTWLADNGCELPDLAAPTVAKAITQVTDPDVKRVLEIRRDMSKTSVKKYDAMLDRVDPEDHRLRDLFLYYAAITGRWGGRGVQVHNLPRGTVNSDQAIQNILLGDYGWFAGVYPDPMATYSSCVRGAITASPGRELYVADFASIEARVVAWLAGQTDTLELFRTGADIYCAEAAGIYGRTITKSDKYERSVGKVGVLALGYGGGINAFGTMARGYGVDLSPAYSLLWPGASTDEQEKARFAYAGYFSRQLKSDNPDPLDRASGYAADVIKQRWRRKNAKIVQFWADVEDAAIQAVLTGDKKTVGAATVVTVKMVEHRPDLTTFTEQKRPEITFGMYGEHLLCKLPSGNCLVYPFAQVHNKKNDWDSEKLTLSYKVEDENTYQFGRKHTYGGRLVENIVQAVARDLLAEALLRVDEAGFNIVLHVHDEIVADEPIGDNQLEEFEQLVAQLPAWAEGLPMAAEAWRGGRYRK